MDIYELYKRSFPFTVRGEDDVKRILSGAELITERVDGKLAGAAAVSGDTLLMLCTDTEYRGRGIGSRLLSAAEDRVRRGGYSEITVGHGDDYIAPGVPTSKRYFPAVNERLYAGLDDSASRFFENRGYTHCENCNIFDMRFPLEDCSVELTEGVVDGIEYRRARRVEMEAVCGCTDDACPEFTEFYRNEELYDGSDGGFVLAAFSGDTAAGALIVGEEAPGLGSIGCTSVRTAFRGRHIAVNLTKIGTRLLKDMGMREAFLGYTYSGLDRMYGYAGYKICVYYMMAKKRL